MKKPKIKHCNAKKGISCVHCTTTEPILAIQFLAKSIIFSIVNGFSGRYDLFKQYLGLFPPPSVDWGFVKNNIIFITTYLVKTNSSLTHYVENMMSWRTTEISAAPYLNVKFFFYKPFFNIRT